jgi:hypothetical protein
MHELYNAHCHSTPVQRDALAFPSAAPRLQRFACVVVGGWLGGELGELGFVVGVVGVGEGEAAVGELDYGDPEGPDVGLDGVVVALYSFGLHTQGDHQPRQEKRKRERYLHSYIWRFRRKCVRWS